MKSSFLFSSCLALTALPVPILVASTTQNFDAPGTPATTQVAGTAPGPVVTSGGPSGNFLRLLNGTNGENSRYAFDTTDTGAYETINGVFDFRVLPGSAGLADGFHMALAPTSIYGSTGNGAQVGEKPNAPGTAGIGFTFYPNLSDISAHWNNAEQNNHPTITTAAGVNWRANGVFNQAQVTIQRVGNGSNVTVNLIGDSLGTTPGPVFGTTPGPVYQAFTGVLPNMVPYENRVQFGGRTGGENAIVDLDNINVTYSNPFAGLSSTAPGGRLFQNFDSAGTTSYTAAQQNQRTDTEFRPGPLLRDADAGSTGAYLRLIQDGVGSQNNRIALDRAFDSGISNKQESLTFQMRVTSAGVPADGLGVLFLPTASQGLTGNGIGSSHEPNHAGVLGVGIDIYDNSGDGMPGDGANNISLHWDGALQINAPVTGVDLKSGQFHEVKVDRVPVAGGLNVSVSLIPNINGAAGAPVSVITNHFVAGATIYDSRPEFTAASGGAFASIDLDNISTSQTSLAGVGTTRANFSDAAASPWKGYALAQGLAPQVVNENNARGNFVRLMHDGQNTQRNTLAFDQETDGMITTNATGISAEFDFRATSTDQGADGFSFRLIPTALYSASGNGSGYLADAEAPNVPGAFGIGFDLFDAAANDVSLHWDNSQVSIVTLGDGQISLDNGQWHKAVISLEEAPGGINASLSLIPNDGTGLPVDVFTDFFIAGMNLYDYRAEFVARSGASNMSIDLDNIAVTTVPEPSTLVLLALAALFPHRRR